MSDLSFRWAADDADRDAVYRMRYSIYVEGQGLFLDEADHERRWLVDEDDPGSHIVMAELDGELIGTVRVTWGGDAPFRDATRRAYAMERFAGVVAERDMAVITRLVLDPRHRGGEIGYRLFAEAFALAAARGAELILGRCEPHLLSHYRILGSRPFGDLQDHPTNGVLVPIVVVIGDHDHLRRVGSPLLARARRQPASPALLAAIEERIADPAVTSRDQHETGEFLRHVVADTTPAVGGLLAELSADEARTLVERSHILRCEPGTALYRRGHVSRTVYVVLSGGVDLVDRGGVCERVEGHGSVVGELALLDGGCRSHDAVAGTGGARVLALSDSHLGRLRRAAHEVAAKLLHALAGGVCEQLARRATLPRAA